MKNILLSLLFALCWVKLTRIGPVVMVISEKHGMGVHTGDFIGLAPLVVAMINLLSKFPRAGRNN